jgi:hypothetical protein
MPPREGKMQPGLNTFLPGPRAEKMSAQASRGMDPLMLHRVFRPPRKQDEGGLKSAVAPCASSPITCAVMPLSEGRQGGRRLVGRMSACRTIARPQEGQSMTWPGVSASVSWAAGPFSC